MGKLTFKISYNTNPTLVLNPAELLELYLYGVPICNHQGQELTSSMISQKILASQQWLEDLLSIKLNEQIIRESSPYVSTEYGHWGFVQTSYSVKYPVQLQGYYNQILQISYPSDWLSFRTEKSSLEIDRGVSFKQIHIIPSGSTGSPQSNGVIYSGSVPFASFLGISTLPNYWVSSYFTGFQVVPVDLVDAIGKLASMQLLIQLGDTVGGAIGQSSYSIGLDGLSQSTSLIRSGDYGIFGSRIKQYTTDLFGADGHGGLISVLKGRYKGVTWTAC